MLTPANTVSRATILLSAFAQLLGIRLQLRLFSFVHDCNTLPAINDPVPRWMARCDLIPRGGRGRCEDHRRQTRGNQPRRWASPGREVPLRQDRDGARHPSTSGDAGQRQGRITSTLEQLVLTAHAAGSRLTLISGGIGPAKDEQPERLLHGELAVYPRASKNAAPTESWDGPPGGNEDHLRLVSSVSEGGEHRF